MKLTHPSVTLANFSVTFDGSNTTLSASSLSVSVSSASVTVGAFNATATGLTITVSLTDGSTTIVAASLDFAFGSYLHLTGTSITINTSPTATNDPSTATVANAYLTVGTATATINAGSFSITGSATSFLVINHNGTAEFHAGLGFSVTLTTPTPAQMHLPSWLGFSITKFEISWPGDNFNSDPSNFQLTLSASINSIQGLPGGVTVSGEITDAVIDVGKLIAGKFPITSIGSVGGSVSGTLFGMELNAGFVIGIVSFNAANQIVSGGTVTKLTSDSHNNVTESVVVGGDTTVVNSILYVGVQGGATIPGVGGVQIYIGFSSLGPLTFYLSAEFPLIIEPNSGIAIGGFSGGVIFDYSLPTPSKPQDLANIALSPEGLTAAQWQQQLRDQTVTQYTASGGGTDLTAAYNQPFVLEAGATIYDAYLTSSSFKLVGNIAIQIDPGHPNSINIYAQGTATFGDTVSFDAWLYVGITISGGSSTATAVFLVQAPAGPIPVESFGGALTIGFTDSAGTPLSAPAAIYDSNGLYTLSVVGGNSFSWTGGTGESYSLDGGKTFVTDASFTGPTNGMLVLKGATGTTISATVYDNSGSKSVFN